MATMKKITDFKKSKIHAIWTDKTGKSWITHTYRYGSCVTEELTLNASPVDYLWETRYVTLETFKFTSTRIVTFYKSQMAFFVDKPFSYIYQKISIWFWIKKHQFIALVDGITGAAVFIENSDEDRPITIVDYKKSIFRSNYGR